VRSPQPLASSVRGGLGRPRVDPYHRPSLQLAAP
jgi:hypothetical protein